MRTPLSQQAWGVFYHETDNNLKFVLNKHFALN